MKNITLLLLLLLCGIRLAWAQNIQLGVKGGGNLAVSAGSYHDYHLGWSIQDEEIYANGSSFTYAVGGFINLPLGTRFNLSAEILLSNKTLVYEYYLKRNYRPSYSDKKYKMMKIEFPVLFGYRIFLPLMLYAGPSYGLISTEDEGFASGEFCINAGISYDIMENLIADARASFGLTNLYNGDGYGYLKLKPEMTTNVYFLTVGYRFSL